ncbi:MAG: non-homologous end-joining DNA ligase [Bacteroidota bacterium]
MANQEKIKINNKEISLSKTDKILYPDSDITKADIIEYYRKIWENIAPYATDRALVMQRFPDGIKEQGFFQKKISDYFPGWIETITIKEKESNGKAEYVNCNKEETIVYLANQGSLVLHGWLSKKSNVNKPDKMVFDLDPSDNDFEKVKQGALLLKELLDQGNIHSYPLITGSKGIHVIIPLKEKDDFDDIRNVAKQIAEIVTKRDDKNFTTETSKNKRGHKVFVDYLRNSYGQTSILPYSLRAIDNAPVAVPLDWDEIKDKELDPQKYNISNIFHRISQKQDPWKDMNKNAVDLTEIKDKLTD